MDNIETNQEDFKQDISIEPLEENTENSQHLSDVLVTQIILCIAIVTSIFVLNIFQPNISTYIIDKFKYHSSVEFSETIKNILNWLYDRI